MPEDWKKADVPLQDGQVGGSEELQVSQPHINPWESDGASNCVSISKYKKDKKVIWSTQKVFMEEKSCLTDLRLFPDEMTGLVEERSSECGLS